MGTIENNILDIVNKYYLPLMNIANVQGIGLGYKHINNIETNEPCIHVLVSDKVSNQYLTCNNIIPSYYMGVRTDVIKTGKFSFSSSNSLQRPRPLQGGCSIGAFDNKVRTFGSLGCIVTKNGKQGIEYYILSNNHVLANLNTLKKGTTILQPSFNDGGVLALDKVATLSDFVKIKFKNKIITPKNTMDAAIAKIDDKSLISNLIYSQGKIKGVGTPKLQLDIKKVGYKTGLTTGKILTTDAVATVEVDGKTAFFKNQINAQINSSVGDSGSVVLNKDNEVLGLMFLGSKSGKFAMFTDIKVVLKAMKVSLYTG